MANTAASQNKKLASALNFVSFLLLNLSEKEREEIKQVLLFDSKVFIDTPNGKLGSRITEIAKQFAYPVDFSVGKIEDQKKIQAFVLYSQLQLQQKAGTPRTLISWEVIKPDSKRVLLNKRLFGYVQFGKSYPGLVQRYSADKLGKGCISVPTPYAQQFLKVFQDMKISIVVKEVLEIA
jgi:hypothetical protein